VAEIFGLALATAMNSFKPTGIFPFNPDIFIDSDFIASETTNIQECHDMIKTINILNVQPTETIEVSQECDQDVNEPVNILDLQTVVSPIQISTPINNIMCTKQIESGQSNIISPITPVTKKNTSFPQVSPIDVIPIPQQTFENKQKKKKNVWAKGKTAILTDSPYKNELQVLQQQLNQKIKKKKKRMS